ncbi:Ig-like domain-containing protein, partial [Methylorubrum extorquens]
MDNQANIFVSARLFLDTGTSNEDGITSNRAIKGSGTPAGEIVLRIGGKDVDVAHADANGEFFFEAGFLPDGAHEIGITDVASNTSTTVSLVLDTERPSLVLALSSGTNTSERPNNIQPLPFDPDAQAVVLNGPNLSRDLRVGGSVTGVETDIASSQTVVSIFDENNTHIFSKHVNISSNSLGAYYAFKISLPSGTTLSDELSSMIDGQYYISAQVADLAGNTATTARTKLVVDTTADAGNDAQLKLLSEGKDFSYSSEGTFLFFGVHGLDADAEAVASFSDGVTIRSVRAQENGRFQLNLDGLTGRVSSHIDISDNHGNALSRAGDSFQFLTHIGQPLEAIPFGGLIYGSFDVDTVSYIKSIRPMIIDIGAQLTSDGNVNDRLVSIENVTGSAFDDLIKGGSVTGGLINGGAGIDTISYEDAQGGVVVDLGAQLTSNGVFNDRLISIENVTGSAFDDLIKGGSVTGGLIN